MKVKKLGHCALVLEVDGVRILTDPGNYSIEAQEAESNIDIILITHEHQDHFHVDSVKKILGANHNAVVVTNASVGKLLADIAVTHTQVGDGEAADVKGVKIEGFGKDHALVYPPATGLVENTGYMVAHTFYFPGDNFHLPAKPVDILALPVAGPWMKMSEAVDFAKIIKARVAFGVHDGMIQPKFRGFIGNLLKNNVPETEYVSIADGETKDF